jgi:hypothetical protein
MTYRFLFADKSANYPVNYAVDLPAAVTLVIIHFRSLSHPALAEHDLELGLTDGWIQVTGN